ncbi:hypothetical protein [Vulcanisaeta distributa]|uniref:hypothetical protein n=1 Tax=Vulcanisaeta distributa TaxID=164451 RepID=UPI0006CFE5A7|nr:hypothetical protein [Vulcanisaeta distributa]
MFWIEGGGVCNELGQVYDSLGIRFRCTSGSKRRAFKQFGVFDDDLDFAFEFLRACRTATLCIAVVRDERIERFINKFVLGRYRGIADRVFVYRTPKFTMSRDELLRFSMRVLDEVLAILALGVLMHKV